MGELLAAGFVVAVGVLLIKSVSLLEHGRERRRTGVLPPEVTKGRAEPLPISQQPDLPRPFGYKTGWAAVRCGDAARVLKALSPASVRPANWETGLAAAECGAGVFVSPVLSGFVLVIGWGGGLSTGAWECAPLPYENLDGGDFTEVQLFASHRVSDFYRWEKYVCGAAVRRYCFAGGRALWSAEPLTMEERALGFDHLPWNDQAAGQRLPTEEDVLNIAAAWGVDPRFENKKYPPSTGWLCTV
ncbi:hypothetical protein [Oscillibacter sp.]|uniref:hypothetical protein n=1 Tax=Oscillibacter sp. TaxID=1945593 RepID=UPI0026060ED3|nr:hypothetical protein [Oscillibacter sp.]MDD3346372.1 hypothetical protein [Oscillibacter sp.]